MDTLIKPDGTIQPVEPKNSAIYALEELQEFVGGYIEILSLSLPGKGHQLMVINEEGKLQNLAHNLTASRLYGGSIVGKALVCSPSHIE